MIFKNYEVKKRLDFYNFTFKIARFQEDICKANLLSDSPQKHSSVHEKIIHGGVLLEFITRRIFVQTGVCL